MELVFLGTSCMVPTKERNVAAVFLSFNTEGILFDCGEGTQRQMNICGINRNRITKILISHWHGDHIGGLIGLLQTLSSTEENKKLTIFGPKGTKKSMKCLIDASDFDSSNLDLNVIELDPKGIESCFDNKDFTIECAYLEHAIPCLGFSFIEKDRRRINMSYLKKLGVEEGPHLKKLQEGKSIEHKGKKIDVEKATSIVKGSKITYVMDTVICDSAIKLAKDSDILICESAYADNLEEKAETYKHLTARQAGMIANSANVKKLVLTHFSQRYKTTQEIEENAKTVFSNSVCAYDFMKIKI